MDYEELEEEEVEEQVEEEEEGTDESDAYDSFAQYPLGSVSALLNQAEGEGEEQFEESWKSNIVLYCIIPPITCLDIL